MPHPTHFAGYRTRTCRDVQTGQPRSSAPAVARATMAVESAKGLGFSVEGLGRGVGFRVSGFRVSGFRIQMGLGFRVILQL